ncbi:MAG: ATP synthase F1 subunit epsilon [Rhodospirillales bacterium]|nr:ATP synthase F1 subunit epsilon [Rhodospirillales bacterium]MDP6804943.1 ATP synthase F1 subunit epsilon [Rhodospirillales bacterium]
MADKVLVELVTPVEVILSREVDMVVVPGGDGDFGILPGHAPLLSTLRPGVVNIYEGGAVTDSVFVADGFAEATEARVTILAEDTLSMSEATNEAAQARIAEARRQIDAAEDDGGRAAGERALGTAEALAQVLERRDRRP